MDVPRDPDLSGLFAPERVAVVGATDREGSVGRAIVENLAGFQSDVVGVNPSYDEVLGHPCYPEIADVPDPVDLAVIVMPASVAVQEVREAAEAGVERVVVTAGFGETGAEGAARDRDLAGVTVTELADELGADVLTSAPTDAYVERFLVGAMSGEAALRHFRRTRNAAVITGGDRSDIHTAALEAPGVACLVLTGGFEPPGAVLGRAEEAGVPVLVVQSDTLTAVDRAENVVHSGRVRDARTVERVRELLFEHADVDLLLSDGD